MNDLVHQINGISNTTFHQASQNKGAVFSSTDSQADDKKSSHKYLLENNVVVYEKYDQYGKLISRVPWSHKPMNTRV